MRMFKSIHVERINHTSQVARYFSNRALRKFREVVKGDVVNVSGWKDEDKQRAHYKDYFPNKTSYCITNYSGESGYQGNKGELFLDLNDQLPPEFKLRFDVAFCHTVLEVFDVQVAFANLALPFTHK